jgi:hypothetical protein
VKNEHHQIKPQQAESPTAFELAQLAVMIQGRKGNHEKADGKPNMTQQILAAQGRVPPPSSEWAEPVRAALDLWQVSTEALAVRDKTRETLSALRDGIMTLTSEEWKAHAAECAGSLSDIDRLLDESRVSTAELKRRLFRDSSLSKASRDKLFIGLIKWATEHTLPFSDGRSFVYHAGMRHDELPAQMTGRECRHFIEAHEARASMNKRRIIPASLRQTGSDRYDRIRKR